MKNFRKVDCIPAKRNALYLSVNIFSTNVLFGNWGHYFYTGLPFYVVIGGTRRSSCLQVKRVPSFLSYFKTLSTCPPPGIEPATSLSAVKRSTDWANPARPITIKFRIRKETSKPQTNYHWYLRFSYLAPYWLIYRNTITFHKYFWCWNWKGLPCNGKVSTIGTYRFKPFMDTPIRPGIISSGTRSFLIVTETLAGTLGGLKKHKHLDRDRPWKGRRRLISEGWSAWDDKTLYYMKAWNRLQNYWNFHFTVHSFPPRFPPLVLSVRYSVYAGKKGHKRHQNYGMTKGWIKEILRDRSFIIR